jgi:hypothetical protein
VWPLRGPSYSLSPALSPIVGMNKYVLIDRYVISISKDVKSVEDSTVLLGLSAGAAKKMLLVGAVQTKYIK